MSARATCRVCPRLSSKSAAGAFLSPRSQQQQPSRSAAVVAVLPDFLLPRLYSSSSWQHLGLAAASASASRRTQTRRVREFATSSQLAENATVLRNPRKDDDGNDMNIEITGRASKRLQEIMTKDGNPNLALRIQVESGGCHGFQYLISLTTLPDLTSSSSSLPGAAGQQESTPALNTSSSDPNAMPSSSPPRPQTERTPALNTSSSDPNAMPSAASPSSSTPSPPTPAAEVSPALNTSSSDPNAMPSSVSPSAEAAQDREYIDEEEHEDEDTIFAAPDGSGAKVVMDGPSLELLKGSKIDFSMELIGSQFKIVDNPLATSSCGCGTSFDIKV